MLGDPRSIDRAVTNALDNAIRYGRSTIRLSGVADGLHGLIHIEDDGPGIATSERSRVLEPFTRIDDSRSRESGGVGLGLAIISRIMKCHGGSVTIGDSDLGGTRVSLQFPLARPPVPHYHQRE